MQDFLQEHFGQDARCSLLAARGEWGHTLALGSWWWWLHFVVGLFVLKHPHPVPQLGQKIKL